MWLYGEVVRHCVSRYVLIGTWTIIVSVALVWGFQLSQMAQVSVRSFAEVENAMTGVERLVAYKFVPQEVARRLPGVTPPSGWPRGVVEFQGVAARYRPELPLVLQDVSVKVLPDERVGICGRTSSGKSTFGLLFFRIIEAEAGKIFIDGVDTRTLGLQDLRQRIGMIPQDPVLFRMAVRQNLDPFGHFDDERIWSCLHLVCMEDAIRSLEGELAYQCAERGQNFSVGQMQLLCIARTLLHNPGLVMMDDATANMDRTHLRGAMVLTIAHRISTIADSSKIAVFEQGKLEEIGTPGDLAARPGGLFRALLDEAQVELPTSAEVERAF